MDTQYGMKSAGQAAINAHLMRCADAFMSSLHERVMIGKRLVEHAVGRFPHEAGVIVGGHDHTHFGMHRGWPLLAAWKRKNGSRSGNAQPAPDGTLDGEGGPDKDAMAFGLPMGSTSCPNCSLRTSAMAR